MPHLAQRRFLARILPLACALLILPAAAVSVFAQHGGIHVGGGYHPPAPMRPPIVRLLTPVRPVGVPGLRGFAVPPIVGFARAPRLALPVFANRFSAETALAPQIRTSLPLGHLNLAGAFLFPPLPFRPFRRFPIQPPFAFGFPGFGLFGQPFFGLGFNIYSGFWPNCDLSLGWAYDCYGLPVYGAAPEYAAPFFTPYFQIEPEIQPLYVYGAGESRYVELFLKDGTVYNVIDYWVVNNQLHFKTVEENGSKVVEHVIDFDQLDLQRTVDVNTQRGFRFVLRDEPIEQYLQDHPRVAPPALPRQPAPEPGGGETLPQTPQATPAPQVPAQ